MPSREEQIRELWHEMWTRYLMEETPEGRQQRFFKEVIYELSLLIDEYGYEAVYFGVGCEVFPDAINPWEGNEH